jgi:transposase
MAHEGVAFYMIHTRRSKEAFTALIDDGAGLRVSDGDGGYRSWVEARHTGWAHLIRTARGLAARPHAALAACGAWAVVERQRLCQMAQAPPTGGAWRAWYARGCKWRAPYHDRPEEAGRFARRVWREMASLWVLLVHHGVEPTNHRAERAVRFGVQWRKRSLGPASAKGHRGVERIWALQETCRLRAVSPSPVLVDAMTSLCTGQPPHLAWLQ